YACVNNQATAGGSNGNPSPETLPTPGNGPAGNCALTSAVDSIPVPIATVFSKPVDATVRNIATIVPKDCAPQTIGPCHPALDIGVKYVPLHPIAVGKVIFAGPTSPASEANCNMWYYVSNDASNGGYHAFGIALLIEHDLADGSKIYSAYAHL